eukprot:g660.t1
MAEAELAALRAENARLKAEAEVAQLKAQMAQLAAENESLRGGGGGGSSGSVGSRRDALPAFGEPGYRPPPIPRDKSEPARSQRKLIEFPVCEDDELDQAFEEMMTECLSDEGKRKALRQTYYEQTNQEGKYYFFLEWASYLRKPEVLEQNSVQEQSLDLGDGDGMRRRKGSGVASVADTHESQPFDDNDGKYGKHARRRVKSKASPQGTIFQYFILVMAISLSLYLFRFFMGWGSPFGAQTLEEDRGGSEWDE